MRQINPEAVVIMITSLAMRRVVEDALAAGAANFIRKDTPKAQMVEIIKETISCYLVPDEEEHADETAAAE
jgi:two-component system chemotaxis response regulator CheY